MFSCAVGRRLAPAAAALERRETRRIVAARRTVPQPDVIRRIILLSHGESRADEEFTEYSRMPNWQIPLSDRGREQAVALARRIAGVVGDEPLHFFTSPYVRCKETYRLLIESGEFNYAGVHEDARLRDCDLGNFHDLETLRSSFRERETFGKFFYRFPHGESGADVCDRVTSFLESLHRGSWSMPVGTNVVVLGHGLTTKLMVMRWFRLSVNDFEAMKTPPPASCCILERRHFASGAQFELAEDAVATLGLQDHMSATRGVTQEGVIGSA